MDQNSTPDPPFQFMNGLTPPGPGSPGACRGGMSSPPSGTLSMGSLPVPIERGLDALLETLYLRPRLGWRAVRRLLRGVARCRVGEIEILIGISSENEQVRAETYETKEPETLKWLRKNLRDGDVFFD